jgi:3-methyladenine DNA glycosylase AlkD
MSVGTEPDDVAGVVAAGRSLIEALRTGLRAGANPDKAQGMRDYMHSELPFHGVQKPAREKLARAVFAGHPLPDRRAWETTVRALWDEATHREERYFAVDLTGYRAYRHWQDSHLLPLYEHLIVTGAWWDFVDEISIRRVGPLLRADPQTMTPVLRRWAGDADRWKRRCAVICQIGSGTEIDLALLTDAIDANADDRDFFLRKGIGWALRQHARADPAWVARFVAERPGLSPLSRREALKHIA